MKNYKVGSGLFCLFCLSLFSSCEHRVETKTIVREDGSLDKTIVLFTKKSAQETKNYFGIGAKQGWEVSVDSSQSAATSQWDSSKSKNISC